MVNGPSSPPRPSVDDAVGLLRSALKDAIRAEQLRDGLTGLANDESLSEWTEEMVENGAPFWMAFVEVDQFKSINDKYGYDDADELLKRIAGQLELAAKDFFPEGTVAFRAHGDEFFIAGKLDRDTVGEELIARALDQVRQGIASIRIWVKRMTEPMQCTVSVGWLLSSDLLDLDAGLTLRTIRGKLELAVTEAKQTRNKAVRFSKEMTVAHTSNGRADCHDCHAKFNVIVKQDRLKAGSLHCPNCGAAVSRPPALVAPGQPSSAHMMVEIPTA